MKAPAIKQIKRAIQHGMALGLSLEQSLAREGIKKSVYLKYKNKKGIKKALENGESLFNAYWETQLHDSIRMNKTGSMQLLLEVYKAIKSGREKGSGQSIPKISFMLHQEKK